MVYCMVGMAKAFRKVGLVRESWISMADTVDSNVFDMARCVLSGFVTLTVGCGHII